MVEKQNTIGGTTLFQTPDRVMPIIDENDTVQKFLPKDVKLTLPDYTTRNFRAGVQVIPRYFAEHPWLIANGMVDIPQASPLPPMMQTAPVGSHAYAKSVSGGTGLYDATLIQDPRLTDADLRASQEIAAMASANVAAAQEALQRAIDIKNAADQSVADNAVRIDRQQNDARPIDERDIGGGLVSSSTPETEIERNKRIISSMSAADKKSFDKMSDVEKADWLALQK